MSKKFHKSQNMQRNYKELERAEELVQHRHWQEIVELLEPFVRRYPLQRDGWAMLGAAYNGLDNRIGLWDVTDKMLALEPEEPDNWYNCAMVSIGNNMPFSALYYANEFLDQWPNNQHAIEVREKQIELERICTKIQSMLDATATIENLTALEQIQMMLSRGNYKDAEELSLELIPRLPGNPAPLNNLSLSYALQGNYQKAVQYTQQVLERDPANIHALSNLTQYFMRLGERSDAELIAQGLRVQRPTDDTTWAKQIEAFAFLGDDQAVIELYNAFEKTLVRSDSLQVLPHHLAAVSFARQGDLSRARQLWEKALKVDPKFSLARDNLDDLKKPDGERSGAWPFSLGQWIPQAWLKALYVAATKGQRSDTAMKRETLRALEEHPGLATILPILLERGDPQAREFAVRTAIGGDLPILRDFVLGENGTDQDRLQAAQHLVETGVLPRGKPVSLFAQGKRQEILLLDYEIYSHAQPNTIPKQVQKLIAESNTALHQGRYEDALRTVNEALKIAPDEPSLLNHLAAAQAALGRSDDSNATIRQMAERFPDYLFTRSAMAQLCIREGKLEEARQWIEPLLKEPHFHVSEFSALCIAQCELFIAEGQKDGAQTWLNFWKQAEPDNPQLALFRDQMRQHGLQ